MKPAKFADGVIAQEMDPSEVIDKHSHTIAFVKMFDNGHIGLLWSPLLFCNPQLPLPDELREELVAMLRLHADKLESREMDRAMKEIYGKRLGET